MKKTFEILKCVSLDFLLGEFKCVETDELFDLFGGTIYGCTAGAGCPNCIKCGLPNRCK